MLFSFRFIDSSLRVGRDVVLVTWETNQSFSPENRCWDRYEICRVRVIRSLLGFGSVRRLGGVIMA